MQEYQAAIRYWGFGYYFLMGALGLCVGCLARNSPTTRRVSVVVAAIVGAGTVYLTGLSLWILQVDPRRDTGAIPLPLPWPVLTESLLIFFWMTALALHGWLLSTWFGHASRKEKALYSVVALGSLPLLIWCTGVVVD